MRKIDRQNAILAAVIAALSAAAVKQVKSVLKKQMQIRLRDYSINIEDPEDSEEQVPVEAEVKPEDQKEPAAQEEEQHGL